MLIKRRRSSLPMNDCKNLGIFLTFTAFEWRGIFIVPHMLRHGTSCFAVLSRRNAWIYPPFTTAKRYMYYENSKVSKLNLYS